MRRIIVLVFGLGLTGVLPPVDGATPRQSAPDGGAVCIAVYDNPVFDHYLQVCADPYGSWAATSFGGEGALYNPGGPFGPAEFAQTSGFFLFRASEQQRELLSNVNDWQQLFDEDTSLDREITIPNVASDSNGDGVDDTMTGQFRISGKGVDLLFDVTQSVGLIIPAAGSIIAVLEQYYAITNQSKSAVEFVLLRTLDGDLVWVGDEADDVVGTQRAASGSSVFMQEVDETSTRITVSIGLAGGYYGGKHGIMPGGMSPAYGLGTDVQTWEAYGMPSNWSNHIAGVGYGVNGTSGAGPAGCIAPCDGFVGLEVPVSLAAGAAPGSTVTVFVFHEFGLLTGCGFWDCAHDGIVDIIDLLTLLSQWGGPGSCDFDGGGVGITDFLALLAHWGVCP